MTDGLETVISDAEADMLIAEAVRLQAEQTSGRPMGRQLRLVATSARSPSGASPSGRRAPPAASATCARTEVEISGAKGIVALCTPGCGYADARPARPGDQ